MPQSSRTIRALPRPRVSALTAPQNLRNAFIRGRWTEQEVRTFRGAVKALTLGRGKARIVRED